MQARNTQREKRASLSISYRVSASISRGRTLTKRMVAKEDTLANLSELTGLWAAGQARFSLSPRQEPLRAMPCQTQAFLSNAGRHCQ